MRGWVDPSRPLWRLDPHRPNLARPSPRVESLRNEDSSFLSAPSHLLPPHLFRNHSPSSDTIFSPSKLWHIASALLSSPHLTLSSRSCRIHSLGRGGRIHFHIRPPPPFSLFSKGDPVSDQRHFLGVFSKELRCPSSGGVVRSPTFFNPGSDLQVVSHYVVVFYNVFQASLAQNPHSMHINLFSMYYD